jgi:hypothetical protein
MSTTCVLPCLVTNNYPIKIILLTLIAPPNFHFYFTKIPPMFHFGSTWITPWIHSKCTFIPSKIHVNSNIDQVPSTLATLTHHLQCVPVENNRIGGEIAHSKTQRSHKYVNNAWRVSSNSPLTLLFIPFPVPPH